MSQSAGLLTIHETLHTLRWIPFVPPFVRRGMPSRMAVVGTGDSASSSSASSRQQEGTEETSNTPLHLTAGACGNNAQSTPAGASGGVHPQAGSITSRAAAEGFARLPESSQRAGEAAGSKGSDSCASEAVEHQGTPSYRVWWKLLRRWLGLQTIVPGSDREVHGPDRSAASASRHMVSARQGGLHEEENLKLPSERRAAEGAMLVCLGILLETGFRI